MTATIENPRTRIADRRVRLSCAHLYADGKGAVLFVVRRALDGWLAFDLAGAVTDLVGPLEVVRGGARFADRVFALHADEGEVRAGRALGVDGGREPFAFGGDLFALVRAAEARMAPRLRLFRGATVLDSRASLGEHVTLPATHALVFETPSLVLAHALEPGARVSDVSAATSRLASSASARGASRAAAHVSSNSPARPTSR